MKKDHHYMITSPLNRPSHGDVTLRISVTCNVVMTSQVTKIYGVNVMSHHNITWHHRLVIRELRTEHSAKPGEVQNTSNSSNPEGNAKLRRVRKALVRGQSNRLTKKKRWQLPSGHLRQMQRDRVTMSCSLQILKGY